jgi:hypothetical protein
MTDKDGPVIGILAACRPQGEVDLRGASGRASLRRMQFVVPQGIETAKFSGP